MLSIFSGDDEWHGNYYKTVLDFLCEFELTVNTLKIFGHKRTQARGTATFVEKCHYIKNLTNMW